MRLLLDTHILVWAVSSSASLSPFARRLLADRQNDVYFTPVSCLEVAVKRSSGAKSAPAISSDRLLALAKDAGFTELTVSAAHASAVETLAVSHADPFDRLILAQARIEGLQLVTHDETLSSFDDRTIVV